MQKNGPLALAFNALVITFMLAPLLVVCIVAFTPHNTLTLPTTEFSLRWFKAVFAHSDFVQSFWNSLWLALASATLATVVYDEYLHELNWPLGAAIALTLLVANLVVMLSYNRLVEGRYKKSLG